MFDIVLYQPEIPPNTGNLIRLAANTGCRLHLVEPLGFDLSDKQVARAGLDYHDKACVTVHKDWAAVQAALPERRWFALTTKGSVRYADNVFLADDVLLFGPESRGLPPEILGQFDMAHRLRLLMLPGSRSMNLSNAVSVVVFEERTRPGHAPAGAPERRRGGIGINAASRDAETMMIKNHQKIAFRHIRRQKGYSFMNIAGLAIGLAGFLLIGLWVADELSFDRFHEKKDRIFRMLNKVSGGDLIPSPTYALAPALKEEYPEVEEASRVWPFASSLVRSGDKAFEEDRICLVDPGFLRMFTFPLLEGDPATALGLIYAASAMIRDEIYAKRPGNHYARPETRQGIGMAGRKSIEAAWFALDGKPPGKNPGNQRGVGRLAARIRTDG